MIRGAFSCVDAVTSTHPGNSVFTHTLVVLEQGAEAFIADAYGSETFEGQSFASGVVELILAKASKLRYVQMQDWGRDVWNFMTERATLQADATLNSLHVTLGGKFSKSSIGSHLQGEDSLAEMLGISFADGDQFFDHRRRRRGTSGRVFFSPLQYGRPWKCIRQR
jgi:Fe-S cluster assembly protein SufD